MRWQEIGTKPSRKVASFKGRGEQKPNYWMVAAIHKTLFPAKKQVHRCNVEPLPDLKESARSKPLNKRAHPHT